MALRLGGLADLDPTAVPLPAGTEVTTRVDRVVDGELRPQGATGRVASLDGDHVDVAFIDGKRARYLRSDPRGGSASPCRGCAGPVGTRGATAARGTL